jgi:preprotein translocase subunit YajC
MGKGKGGKEEKARQALLKQLKRGDRIQTIGGIQGAVVRAEEARVEVKVDESSNTKIWFARSAIARVIEAAKADAK